MNLQKLNNNGSNAIYIGTPEELISLGYFCVEAHFMLYTVRSYGIFVARPGDDYDIPDIPFVVDMNGTNGTIHVESIIIDLDETTFSEYRDHYKAVFLIFDSKKHYLNWKLAK